MHASPTRTLNSKDPSDALASLVEAATRRFEGLRTDAALFAGRSCQVAAIVRRGPQLRRGRISRRIGQPRNVAAVCRPRHIAYYPFLVRRDPEWSSTSHSNHRESALHDVEPARQSIACLLIQDSRIGYWKNQLDPRKIREAQKKTFVDANTQIHPALFGSVIRKLAPNGLGEVLEG
jgi:hypothetical protein